MKAVHLSSPLVLVLTSLLLTAPILGACKIVPIAPASEAPKGFDAAAYVEGLWQDQVLPLVDARAVPLDVLMAAVAQDLDRAGQAYGHRANAEGAAWSFLVSMTGVVAEKNTQSRVGTLIVTAPGKDGPLTVTVQIGPVLRGTAVRDVLPFVSFQNFINQLDFAQVGRAMNDRALAPLAGAIATLEPGQTVRVVGAMTLAKATDQPNLTPIRITSPAGTP